MIHQKRKVQKVNYSNPQKSCFFCFSEEMNATTTEWNKFKRKFNFFWTIKLFLVFLLFVWMIALWYLTGDKYRECSKLIQLPGKLFLLYALLLCQENDVYSKHLPLFSFAFQFSVGVCWFCNLEHIFGIWGCEHYDWDCVFSWLVLLVYSQYFQYFVSLWYCAPRGSSEEMNTQKNNPIPQKNFLLATHLLCQEIDVNSKHFCPFSFAFSGCVFGFALWSRYLVFEGV